MPLNAFNGACDGKPWQAGVPGGGQKQSTKDSKVLLNVGQQGGGKSK